MQPLVEDLQKLWKGVLTWDVLAKEPKDEHNKFLMRAAILHCIHDYPGYITMSGRVTSGYNACVHSETKRVCVKIQNKIAFFGHRVFLDKEHPYRKNRKKLQFLGKRTEPNRAPEKFKINELKAHLEKVRNVKPGKPLAATEANTENAEAA